MRVPDRQSPRVMVELPLAAVVGAMLLWLANLLVPAATAPFQGHGERFAAMARAPLSFEGEFPQRILWPLLAWLAGRVGVGVVAFSQLCSWLLLAGVFWFARRRADNGLDALLVTASIAVSGAVLVYQPMACFSDQLSLLSMVLLVHFAARPRVFWPLVLLSAASHEMVFFFWPWLIYLRCRNGGVWWREGLALAACLASYLAFRAPMGGSYGVHYYIEHSIWVPWALPAMWALWAFLVLVEFGPLLVVVAWAWCSGELSRPTTLGGRYGPLLYLAGVLPLMVLAYDVMRFATFVFLPLLLGSLALVRVAHGRVLLAGLVVAATASYLWLHPNPADQGGAHFTLIAADIRSMLDLLATRDAGDAVTFMHRLLVHWWTWAAWAAAAAGGLTAAGWWLAQVRPRPDAAGASA